jgi:nucleoside-diphosphate-sugar epimerase
MRVLVTGASGFVGKKLVIELISQGFDVKVVSRNISNIFPENVQVFNVDITDLTFDLSSVVENCDIIINCAGEIINENAMRVLHVDGTQRLLEAFVKYSSKINKHWIQLSSVGAYGRSSKPNRKREITELSELNPNGTYEVTKTLADEMIINFSKRTAMTYTILRPSNIVGMFMPNQSFYRLLNAISKKRFFFIGSKESISTYIHIDDIVDALIVCATNKKAHNQIFNLSNDCYLAEILTSVCKAFGFKSNFLLLPEKPLRFLVYIFSKFLTLPLTKSRIDALVSKTTYPYTKIQDVLGFAPKRSIPEFAVEYYRHLNVKT